MKIISGIKPTGDFHLGNYLGALKNWVELQESNSCLFFLADLHSLTADPISAQEKEKLVKDLMVNLLSIGLSPEKSILFAQSQVPAHSELAWIFNCLTPMGELERMTQYKDKIQRQKENINVGLFTYPALMAADILLYDVDSVPVGEDQLQHLELTRETARRFNRRYGELFKEPKGLLAAIPRVMSLKNPLIKMSKSDPSSCIGVFDSPDEIRKKIKGAVSADNSIFEQISWDGEEFGYELKGVDEEFEKSWAGVKNILGLLREFNPKEFNDIFDSQGKADLEKLKYGEIKETLAEGIISYFAPMKEKKEELLANMQEVEKIYQEGALKANEIASKKMRKVKELIGLI